MIRILHTSDVQLDAKLGFLGERAAAHRRQLASTFDRILQHAVEDAYDLVVIAGDLFDTFRVTEATLTATQRACARCALPIAILPGNHDHFGIGSVYHDGRWPGNVHIMDGQPWQPAGLDLLVHGHPLASAHDSSPLKDVARNGRCQFEIALAHGNMERGDLSDQSRLIRAETLLATRMDYVAMGDWHQAADYSQGSVTAWYSGAPEPTSFTQSEAGDVLEVRLNDGGITVRRVAVGESRALTLELDVTDLTAEDLQTRILEYADPRLMLDIKLYGAAEPGELTDCDQLTAQLEDNFLCLRVADGSHVLEASLEAMERSGSPLRTNYVRLMHERMQQAADEAERRALSRALGLGLALLDGERVFK